jgi:uncharacterized protein (TIGR03086 family)
VTSDLAAHRTATEEWGTRLRQVRDDQWSLATPCTAWTVRDLANHVVAGNEMSGLLLDGADAATVKARLAGDHLGADPVAAWKHSSAVELAAFAEPGALDRTVHHPVGDVPAEVFLGFRINDYLLHAWDLARATGGDETLDPDAVAVAWASLEPMAPIIATIGMFGTGPSGTVAADAPFQTRLLDLSGRRA